MVIVSGHFSVSIPAGWNVNNYASARQFEEGIALQTVRSRFKHVLLEQFASLSGGSSGQGFNYRCSRWAGDFSRSCFQIGFHKIRMDKNGYELRILTSWKPVCAPCAADTQADFLLLLL
jgi:hypothetical protein